MIINTTAIIPAKNNRVSITLANNAVILVLPLQAILFGLPLTQAGFAGIQNASLVPPLHVTAVLLGVPPDGVAYGVAGVAYWLDAETVMEPPWATYLSPLPKLSHITWSWAILS